MVKSLQIIAVHANIMHNISKKQDKLELKS